MRSAVSAEAFRDHGDFGSSLGSPIIGAAWGSVAVGMDIGARKSVQVGRAMKSARAAVAAVAMPYIGRCEANAAGLSGGGVSLTDC